MTNFDPSYYYYYVREGGAWVPKAEATTDGGRDRSE
jgi:hypothetical protein